MKKKNFVSLCVLTVIVLSAMIFGCKATTGGGGDSTVYNYGNSGIDTDNDGYDDDVDCNDNDPTVWQEMIFYPDTDDCGATTGDGLADTQNGTDYCVGLPDTYPQGMTQNPNPDLCPGCDPQNTCTWPQLMLHWAYPTGTHIASVEWDCANPPDPAQPWVIELERTGHDSSDGNEVLSAMSPELWNNVRDTCKGVIHTPYEQIFGCAWGMEEYSPSYNAAFAPPDDFCDVLGDLANPSPTLYVDRDGTCPFAQCATLTWEFWPHILEAGINGAGAHYLWDTADIGGISPPDPDPGNTVEIDAGIHLDTEGDGWYNACSPEYPDDPCPDNCNMNFNPGQEDCGQDGLCAGDLGYPGTDYLEGDGVGDACQFPPLDSDNDYWPDTHPFDPALSDAFPFDPTQH